MELTAADVWRFQARPLRSDWKLCVDGPVTLMPPFKPDDAGYVIPLEGLLPYGEVLATAAEINQKYLRFTERLAIAVPDAALCPVRPRRQSGIIHSTATPYGGWEKPDCELRGHFNGGHYLSAVALAYSSAATIRCAKAAT